MNKTFEELKRGFYPKSEYYDNLVKSGDTGAIHEALAYYREEVYKTLAELEEYFGVKRVGSQDCTYTKKAA